MGQIRKSDGGWVKPCFASTFAEYRKQAIEQAVRKYVRADDDKLFPWPEAPTVISSYHWPLVLRHIRAEYRRIMGEG